MNEDSLHIEDELKEAPILKGLKRKVPFQAPNGYFEAFPDSLAIAIDLPEDPELNLSDRGKLFSVPDGYFDSFEEKLADRIEKEQQKAIVRPFWRKPVYIVGIAAAILVLVVGMWVISPQHTPGSQFSEEELLAALEAEGIEAFELVEALDQEELAAAFDVDLFEDANSDLDEWVDELDVSDLENELMEGI